MTSMIQHAFTSPSPRLYSHFIMHMPPIHCPLVIPLQGSRRRALMPALVRQLHHFSDLAFLREREQESNDVKCYTGFFLLCFNILCFFYLICSFRTNFVLVYILFTVVIGVGLIIAGYWYLAMKETALAEKFQIVSPLAVIFNASVLTQSISFPGWRGCAIRSMSRWMVFTIFFVA